MPDCVVYPRTEVSKIEGLGPIEEKPFIYIP